MLDGLDLYKVLVVDDAKSIMRIMRNYLKNIGFKSDNIISATDGDIGLTEFIKSIESRESDINNNLARIRIIISDWLMKKMNGIVLLKEVRRIELEKGINKELRINFMMVTSQGTGNDVKEAIKEKVTDYIVKPFPELVLQAKMKKLIINLKTQDDLIKMFKLKKSG